MSSPQKLVIPYCFQTCSKTIDIKIYFSGQVTWYHSSNTSNTYQSLSVAQAMWDIEHKRNVTLIFLFFRKPIDLWKHCFASYFPQTVSFLFCCRVFSVAVYMLLNKRSYIYEFYFIMIICFPNKHWCKENDFVESEINTCRFIMVYG